MRRKSLLQIFLCTLMVPMQVYNQNVAINNDGSSPSASAILDVKSTNKGAKLPRLTTSQRMAISVTEEDAGLIVFDKDKLTLYIYDGARWRPLIFGNEADLPPITRTSSDNGAGGFGNAVDINGSYAAIGAPFYQVSGAANQGAVYIFLKSSGGWSQQAKILAADGAAADFFGRSVSLSGNLLIIGASGDDANKGSAYIFIRNGTIWTQEAKITSADGLGGDLFGFKVSIEGSYAVVGAHSDDENFTNQGSAYVFFRNGTTWTQQAKLVASDPGANDEFGREIAISGDYVIAGAALDDIGTAANQGSAYVFFRTGTTWTQQAKLTASDGLPNDFFGTSVDISGNYAVVGASSDDLDAGTSSNQGSAYVFLRSGTSWTQQHHLTAFDNAPGDAFGSTVSLDGDYLMIAAPSKDVGINTNKGAVYIYRRNSNSLIWEGLKLVVDPELVNQFGNNMAIDNLNYIISRGSQGVSYVSFGSIN